MKLSIKENYPNIVTKLEEALGTGNVNSLPRLRKVSINVGMGPHRQNKDMVKFIEDTLVKITGQKPAVTKAKKAISGFKIRTGEAVGYKVTLRSTRMYDFLDRLFNVYLPRIREFKGLDTKHIDHGGNYTIGFRELVPFVELGHQATERNFGMEITIVFDKSNPEKTAKLLELLGLPLKLA